MNLNTLAQLIYEEIIQSRINPGITDPNYFAIVLELRNKLIPHGDPLICMNVGNTGLLMNLSHQLPLLRLHPLYDTALPRIAEIICAEEQYLKVIDIGANIGDTVATIAEKVCGSFLCVEGDPHYFFLLQENLRKIHASVVCVNAVCGACDEEVQGYFMTEHGTGHFVAGADRGALRLKSVTSILEDHASFKDANLFKVDTDGFDTCVLRGAQTYLAATGPTVFFEYVPALLNVHEEHPLAIFSYLVDLGYRSAFFYTNLGLPLEMVDLCDQEKLAELVRRIDTVNIGYYDVLLPGRSLPADLFADFCKQEIATAQRILNKAK